MDHPILRTIGLLSILMLTSGSLISLYSPAFSQEFGKIQVIVTDENSLNYDGILVEVYTTALVDSGRTEQGRWTSILLPLDASVKYTVTASSSIESKSKQVVLNQEIVVVRFVLNRTFSKPKLLVSGVTVTPSPAIVGETFDAKLTVKNVGEASAATSSLSLDLYYPFALIGSGSQFDLGQIGVNSGKEVNLKVSVDPKADPGSYSIPYTIKYTDRFGLNYLESSTFGLILEGMPRVKVSNIHLSPLKLTPGVDAILLVTLANIGTQRALDLKASISGTIETEPSASGYVGRLERGGKANLTFVIGIPPDALPGIYPINITLSYKDDLQRSYSEDARYDIRVYAFGRPEIKILAITSSPQKLIPGAEGDLSISLSNIGSQTALDITVELEGPANIFSSISKYLGRLLPGSNMTVSFGIVTSQDLSPGSFPINITMSYEDLQGNTYSESIPFELRMYSPGFTTPYLVVSGIRVMPEDVLIGETFEVELEVENVGPVPVATSSITVNATQPFVILGSSSTLRLGFISTNSFKTVKITLSTDIDTKAGPYTIPYSIQFTDIYNITYKIPGTFGIVLKGSAELRLQSVTVKPLKLIPGTEGEMSLVIINTGTDEAVDVELFVAGAERILASNRIHVGRIARDSVETIILGVSIPRDFSIESSLANITVSYTDLLGKHQTSWAYELRVYVERPQVKVSNIVRQPLKPTPGVDISLTLLLVNAGSGEAFDTLIRLRGAYEGATTSEYIGRLAPGADTQVTFVIEIPKTAVSGMNRLNITLSCKDTAEREYVETLVYEFTVFGIGEPEIKIQKVSFKPEKLIQGVNSSLTVSLINTGLGHAKDITVKLPSNITSITSSFGYVGQLSAGISTDVTLDLNIGKDASPGIYTFPITVVYSDYGGEEVSRGTALPIQHILSRCARDQDTECGFRSGEVDCRC